MNRKVYRYSLLGVVALAIIAGVLLWSGAFDQQDSLLPENQPSPATPTSSQGVAGSETPYLATSTIGRSVEGRDISAYTFNQGFQNTAQTKNPHILFVGGIHGGYEWNSVAISWKLIDYLRANPKTLADNLTVSVIPNANPDAVYAVTGKAGPITKADIPAGADPGGAERFNANGIDLNRNFACNWKPKSFWKGEKVNAGSQPFSEPEARAIRDFVQSSDLSAGIFFHSSAGAVYGATCGNSVGPKTKDLLNTYAQAAGYRAVNRFTAYPVTGDVESWLTKLGIPAVSVELTNHQDTEWQKNLAGIKAVLNLYSK